MSQSKTPSLRANSLWNVAGMSTYAIAQFVVLLITEGAGSVDMVGQYAVALALVSPVFMLTNFQLRLAQAVDVNDSYAAGDYVRARVLGIGAAGLIIAALVLMLSKSRNDALVIAVLFIAKAIEAMSDVYCGLFQKVEKLRLVGISTMARGVALPIAFVVGIVFFDSLVISIALMGGLWLLVLVVWDHRYQHRLTTRVDRQPPKRQHWPLLRATFPLGVSRMLNTVNTNVPIYYLEFFWTDTETGQFALLAYFAVAAYTIFNAIGQAVSPRIARQLREPTAKAFWATTLRFGAVGIGGGLLILLAAYLLGGALLELLYGPEMRVLAAPLVWTAVAIVAVNAASTVNFALIAAKAFTQQMWIFLGLCLVSIAAATLLIEDGGVLAAVQVTVVSGAAQFIVSLALLLRFMQKHRHRLVTPSVTAETQPPQPHASER